jgi:hypothetical protein
MALLSVPILVLFAAVASQDAQSSPAAATRDGSRQASTKPHASTSPQAKPTAPSRGKKSAEASSVTSPQPKAVHTPVASANSKSGLVDDVRVKTKAEMRKPKSPFLLPPGSLPSDRYAGPDDPLDWNDLPPWRRASFFGMQARGQFFVYVVDCSESMIDDDRLPRATIELRRSVFALKEPQRFEVIFYNSQSIPMPGGPRPRTADQTAKNLLLSWLRLIEPVGGTDPGPALKDALMLRPDAVFLLSDGAFPGETVGEVAKLNTRYIPIHCVDVTGGLAGDQLKRIAAASGGQYSSRPGDLQARP